MDRFVSEEVCRETLLGSGVTPRRCPKVFGKLFGPLRPNRFPDALDAVFLDELGFAAGVVVEKQIFREVDIKPFDRIETEGNVAVHPNFSDRHRHLLALDGFDQPFDTVDSPVAVPRFHTEQYRLRGQNSGEDQERKGQRARPASPR
jgi:hypothetical protein